MLHILEHFKENGFFEQVLFVNCATKKTKISKVSEGVLLLEIGWQPKVYNRPLKYTLGPLSYFVSLIYVILYFYKKAHGSEVKKSIYLRSTDPFWIGLYALIVSKILAKSIVFSMHSNYELTGKQKKSETKFGQKFDKILMSFVLSRCDGILVIRSNLKKYVESFLTRNVPVQIVHHGFEFAGCLPQRDPSFRKKIAKESDKLIISFCGRVVSENFACHIIEVVKALISEKINFHFVVVGDGDILPLIQSQIKRLGMCDYVTFTGFVERDVVYKIKVNSDYIFVPMGGMSLIENLCLGAISICYNIDWHSEVIIDGETGFLISPSDFAALCRIVKNTSAADQDTIRKSARELGRNKFDLARIQREKTQFYIDINERI